MLLYWDGLHGYLPLRDPWDLNKIYHLSVRAETKALVRSTVATGLQMERMDSPCFLCQG